MVSIVVCQGKFDFQHLGSSKLPGTLANPELCGDSISFFTSEEPDNQPFLPFSFSFKLIVCVSVCGVHHVCAWLCVEDGGQHGGLFDCSPP